MNAPLARPPVAQPMQAPRPAAADAGPAPTGPVLAALPLADRYGALGEDFFTRVDPSPLADPYLVAVSAPACGLVGVDPVSLGEPESLAALAGNTVLPQSRPLAAVYAGHQFGVWAGRL